MLENLERLINVRYYSYRSARMMEMFFKLPRWAVKDFEDALYKKAGIAQKDNHVCFSFNWNDHSWSDFEVLRGEYETCNAVMFSDFNAYFGREIRPENW